MRLKRLKYNAIDIKIVVDGGLLVESLDNPGLYIPTGKQYLGIEYIDLLTASVCGGLLLKEGATYQIMSNREGLGDQEWLNK